MSRFLDSVSTIISIFHKHAKEDGDCSNFSRRKMKEFIQREFADVIAKPHDPQTIDKILQFLEWDGDGEIDFNEFLLLVFRVAKACYWYLPKGPSLLQRTTLTTSGKSLREPDVKNRGSRRQLQEEEQQTCESDHHPPCEPELQRDTRVNELETLEETGSHHQQCNTQSRKNAKQSSKPEEPIPQVHEEQSQEPCHQRNSQRRRQPPEPDRRGDVQLCKREPGVQADERQNQEGPQPEQLADVRSRSQICQPQPLPKRCSSHQSHGPTTTAGLPAYDQKKQRPQEAERGSNNQPHKPELLPKERSRYHLCELEEKALEQSTHQPHETECLESRHPHQSHIQEPLKLDLRYYEICEPERGIDEKQKNQEHELECPESERDIHEGQECKERDDVRRKEAIRKRRIDHQRELDLEVYERRSRQTREREERGATAKQREICERSNLQILEEEQEREFLCHRQGNDLPCKLRESTPCEPSEDQEWRNHRLSHEEEAREPDRCWTHEDEGRRHERCLYQTVEVDNRDLCPSGKQSSVGNMRVRYIPAEPDVQPEVQVIPQSCEPQTIAYLIHVIQNLNDPEGTNYKIICHQPHDLGQPIYVKKCSVSLQPPAVPCDRRNHPEPRPQRDEQETRESKLPRQGGTPASSSQENTGDLNEPQERSETGVKERPQQASASKPDGVKGDPCQAKPKEDRRDSQHLKTPHAEKKDHQPQGDGSKAAREQVPWEPESSCQVRVCEDREAKSCPPLPQAPEPREACEPGQQAAKESHPQLSRRDEASNCREGAELPLPEKSRQPQQEEKRSPRQASDAQPQREEEPRLCTK